MKSNIFFSVIIGFLLGNILGSRLGLGVLHAIFILIIFVSVFVFLRRRSQRAPKIFSTHLVLFFTLLLAATVGILRFSIADQSLRHSSLDQFEGQVVEMIGKVKQEPQRKTDLAKTNVEVSAVAVGEAMSIKPENITLYADFFEQLSYGDLIIFKGKLERINNREEDSNFDFESYAKKDGVRFQMFRPKVEVERNIGNPIILKLKGLKAFFEAKLAENLSEPHASLVSGMLISGKNALPKDVQNEFIRTGLIHIVVLSGFNIAIIIKFLSSVFTLVRINIRISFVLILGTLVLFVLMAGGTPPVIRAVLMASIFLMGKSTIRQLDANKVLLLVAFILAFINPYSVPFDPSFQLSFLATFAIINLAPIIERYFGFIRSNILRETISQTLAATIFVSPFVLYLMGNFSVVALLVNVLILPFIPILMLFGFLVVAFSFAPLISTLLSFMVVALSSVVFAVVHFTSSLPFASFLISSLPFIFILPIYAAILGFIYKKKLQVSARDAVLDLTEPH